MSDPAINAAVTAMMTVKEATVVATATASARIVIGWIKKLHYREKNRVETSFLEWEDG